MSGCNASIVGTMWISEKAEFCGEVTEVASGSVEAAGTTLLRAIGDSCPIAK